MANRQKKAWSEILRALDDQQRVLVEDAEIEVGEPLRHYSVPHEFNLKNCVVRGRLAAIQCTFAESVVFTDTTFENGLVLQGTTIKGQLLLQNTTIKEDANFEGMNVDGHSFFEQVTFEGDANFATTSFGRHTQFTATRFAAASQFHSSSFAGNLMVDTNCLFSGPAEFIWTSIEGIFNISHGQFAKVLDLSSMHVEGIVLINETNFGASSWLNLAGTRIGGELRIQDSNFEADDANRKCIDMNSARVGGGCRIRKIHCKGKLSASNARVALNLEIGDVPPEDNRGERSTFFDGGLSLASVKVDDSVFLTGLVVKGPADLTGMTVGDTTYINFSEFEQGASINRCKFEGVFGTNARYDKEFISQGSRFHENVRFLPGCQFLDGADFYFSRFEEEANFGGAAIHKYLKLDYANFKHALLFYLETHKNYPIFSTQFEDSAGKVLISLEGCAYGRLTLQDGRTDTEIVKSFIERIPSTDAPSFIFLEQWLRGLGRWDQANAVRYYRHDEAGKLLSFPSWDWWPNRFYRVTSKYGTSVWLFTSVAIISAIAAVTMEVLPSYSNSHPEFFREAKIVFATLASVALSIVIGPLVRRIWPQ